MSTRVRHGGQQRAGRRRSQRSFRRSSGPARTGSGSSRGQRSKGPRIVGAALLVLGVLAAIVLGVLAQSHPRIAAIDPTTPAATARPVISFTVANARRLAPRDVRVVIAGKPVAASRIDVKGTTVRVRAPRLTEGPHAIDVRVRGIGLLQRSVSRSWTLRVDTTAPPIRLRGPAARASAEQPMTVAARTTRMVLRTEANARIVFEAGRERLRTTADASGAVRATVRLREGRHSVRITSRDTAGNALQRMVPVLVDSLAPVTRFAPPARITSPTWSGTANASDASPISTRFLVDGTDDGGVSSTRSGRVTWSVGHTEPLAEGIHVMEFSATDTMGHVARIRRSVLVDSTEELGTATLSRGARGQDVRDLHETLRIKELLDPTAPGVRREVRRGVYGQQTMAAVRSFQAQRGLQADGIAGPDTIASMTLRIMINRATNQLTLYRLDRVVRTYRVATGSARYPTPAGSFRITNMQKHPTWTPPPDSDWAEGLKPIPPGPKNPLGTRWMGLNTPNVGIHGTNNPASIGYSVSHGCIRMAIPDVEDLFERVTAGTPVTVT